MISVSKDHFSVGDALKVLEAAKLDGGYPTQCSMVFLPRSQEVYIALKQDFEKIWKASLKTGLVTTYLGLDDEWSSRIGDEGINASALGGSAPREFVLQR
jgi:hypothetical protein